MPYPDKLDMTYSYTGFAAGLGNGSFPGSQLDADLSLTEARLNALNDFVRGLSRSDGKLANGLVTPDSLSSEARAAFNSSFTPRGPWAGSTEYEVGDVVSTNAATKAYVCLIEHTSAGTFSADLAAGRWLLWAVDGNTAAAIAFTPVGNIAASTVQAALVELDGEKQPLATPLTALAALSPAADKLPYFSSGTTMALADLTSFARTLLDDATAAAMRTTLGLGAMALRPSIATADIEAQAVTTAKIADGAVLPTKLGSGSIIQSVGSQTAAVATGTTTIPLDDTIPQIGEGTQLMTVVITPLSASNALEIEVVLNAAGSTAGGTIIAALFQDSVANALTASAVKFAAAGDNQQVKLFYRMTAGTVSTIVFSLRAGLAAAGTLTMNGSAGARQFGGVMFSSMTAREVKV